MAAVSLIHMLTQVCVCVAAVHGARQEEVIDHRLTDREWAEEWKHLDNVRLCIGSCSHTWRLCWVQCEVCVCVCVDPKAAKLV